MLDTACSAPACLERVESLLATPSGREVTQSKDIFQQQGAPVRPAPCTALHAGRPCDQSVSEQEKGGQAVAMDVTLRDRIEIVHTRMDVRACPSPSGVLCAVQLLDAELHA
jgi:hypothetical protein